MWPDCNNEWDVNATVLVGFFFYRFAHSPTSIGMMCLSNGCTYAGGRSWLIIKNDSHFQRVRDFLDVHLQS